jgi:O-antigen/teichoic acid export membrane protein
MFTTNSTTPSTESPRQRTLASSFILVCTLATKALTNLILVRMALNSLSPESFRLWVVLQSLAAYLSLSEIGLGQTTMNYQGTHYATGNFKKINEVLNTAVVLYLFLISGMFLLTAGISFELPLARWLLNAPSANAIKDFPFLFFLFGMLSLLPIPTTVIGATLSGLRDHPIRQAYELFLPVATVLGVALALWTGKGLMALILIPPLLQLVWGIGSYFVLKFRHAPVQLRILGHFSPTLARSLLSNSAFFFLISFATVMNRSVGNLLTSRFGTTAEVAQVFGLFTLFRVLGWSVVDIVSKVLQPYIILFAQQANHSRILFFAKISSRVSWTLSLAFATLLFIFGKFILGAWLGVAPFVGSTVLGLIALTFLIDVFFLPFFNILVALNHHRGMSFVLIGNALLSVVFGRLGVYLKPEHTILGVFIGFLAASLLTQVIFMPFIITRGLKITLAEFYQRLVARSFLSLAGAILPLFFLRDLALVPSLLLFLAILVWLAVSLWWILFDQDDRNFLLTFKRKKMRAVTLAQGAP